jgi:hypothetical protein
MTKECFVIMPFSETTDEHDEEYWTCFFKDFIKPALCKCGYKAHPSVDTPASILKGIIQDLQCYNLVLAVLTDFNPNVWYELGVRHSLRKGTIMMIERGEDQRLELPFDVKVYGVIDYAKHKDPAELLKDPELEQDFKRHIAKVEAGEASNPVADSLSVPPYADLIYTINRAKGRLREAVTMISRLCGEGYDEEQLIQSIDNELQERWGFQEEVCVVDANREHYRLIYHRDPNYRRGQKRPQDVWCIATEWEGPPENRIPRCQSLFNEIKDSEKGLRVVNLLSPRKRTTAFAYERINQPELIIIVEAHWRPQKS